MQIPMFLVFFFLNLIWTEFSHPGEASFSVIIMRRQLSLCQLSLYMHTLMHIRSQMHTSSLHTQRAALSQIIFHLFDHFESVSLPKSVNVVSWSDMQICTWEKFPLYSVTYHWLEFEMGRKGKYALGRYKNIIAQTYTCSNSTVITPQVMD